MAKEGTMVTCWYPNIKRYPGGASKDLMPDLTNPENPLPGIDVDNPPKVQTTGG